MAPNDTPTPADEPSVVAPSTTESLATEVPDAAAAPLAAQPEPAPKRRRATRKKAAPAQAAPVEAAPAEAAPAEASDPTQAVEAPAEDAAEAPRAKAPRKRASRKKATAPVTEPEVQEAPPAAAPQAPEPPVEEPEEEATEEGEDDEAQPVEESRPSVPSFSVLFQAPDPAAATPRRRRRAEAPQTDTAAAEPAEAEEAERPSAPADEAEAEQGEETRPEEGAESGDEGGRKRSRRRRGGKGRRGRGQGDDENADQQEDGDDTAPAEQDKPAAESEREPAAGEQGEEDEGGTSRRRRRRRRAGSGSDAAEDGPNVSTRVREPREKRDEPVAVKGSTRLEAKKQRRREGREAGRRRTIITEAEFLARRESVDRIMAVRTKGDRTQIGVLEDGVLVEHYIDRETNVSMAGNIYLGRVQNVLPSMEAAFVDIGKGRNAVLYAGEVNWDAAGLESNQPKRIENALSSGQTVLVQVTKDPIGHKGARLTSQISLPGRYLVYVPNSSMTGISRKLPDTERARLKKILRDVVPESAGVIVRTAAEGASEQELRADVERLTRTWEDIQERAEAASTGRAGKSKGRKKNGGQGSSSSGSAPMLLHGEPDMTIRVIRDVFNEDFRQLVVDGDKAWSEIHPYISSVAPDLADRVSRWTGTEDLFTHHRIDEQLSKALDRKVWLPSGGSLVIDRTEAMTVVDVNTGKFVGSGGNLEETVTKNNLEAAEEIVRQLRLRDIGGIIVIDFIDMVLESNRELVIRRLLECLGRDRTKHQVAEVTSLGLVQMTRKRVGSGLLEVFSESCDHCNGRGFVIHTDPVDQGAPSSAPEQPQARSGSARSRRGRRAENAPEEEPAEPARPSGPTAAQIAAAAHAAALKGTHDAVDAGPAADRAEPAADRGEGEAPTSEAVSLPEDSGPWAGQEAPLADAARPAEDEPVATPAVAETVTATPVAAEAPARPRRRRGRVVAPAGPPGGSTAAPVVADGGQDAPASS